MKRVTRMVPVTEYVDELKFELVQDTCEGKGQIVLKRSDSIQGLLNYWNERMRLGLGFIRHVTSGDIISMNSEGCRNERGA